MKRCCRCNSFKPLTDFYKDSRHSDGLRSDCKSCRAESKKLSWQRYLHSNREKRRLRDAKNRQNNSANLLLRKRLYYVKHREQIREDATQYYQTHREKILAEQKNYRMRASESRRAYNRAWNKTDHQLHPEKKRFRKAIRHTRMKGTIVEPINLEKLAIRDNWLCHICKKKVTRKTWSHDHLIPVSANGMTSYLNVALAHELCNKRRGPGRLPAQLRLLP